MSVCVDHLKNSVLSLKAKRPKTTAPPLRHMDDIYDIGLIIGGGSSNIGKNIIGERALARLASPK